MHMISVVIPAYNEERFIGECLSAIVRQNYTGAYEIILVDNGSTDNTVAVAQKFKNKLPLRIISELRKGRGQARHTGFAAAKGSIIFSTDADCIASPFWLEKLTAVFKNPDIDAVAGSTQVSGRHPQVKVITKTVFDTYTYAYRLFFGHYPMGGFNFAVRKSTYKKCGGFDPQLNAAEDVDLGFRIYKSGAKTAFRSGLVEVSPRRYQRGLMHSISDYFSTTIHYAMKNKSKIYLDDVR
jgi:glycosyltransferase involved in cell wall biosynthesis